MSLGPSPDDVELLALVDEYEALLRSGAAPSPHEFASRYPRTRSRAHAAPAGHGSDGSTPRPERRRSASARFASCESWGAEGWGSSTSPKTPRSARRVALKVLPPAWGADSSTRERFTREAQAAAKLEHPHLVPVFGVGADEGLPLVRDGAHRRGRRWTSCSTAFVMRPARHPARRPTDAFAEEVARLRGPDGRGGYVPRPNVAEAARIVLEVASALAHAHERGVVHRDVKPSNVLIDADGARARRGLRALSRRRRGLPHAVRRPGRHVALHGSRAARGDRGRTLGTSTPRGSCSHELLAREPAFAATARGDLIDAIRNRGPRRLRRVDPSIPRDLENVVLRATAREPEQRYPTARALVRDLEAFLDGRPVSAQPPSFAYLARVFVDRHRAAVDRDLRGSCSSRVVRDMDRRLESARSACAGSP